MFLDWRGHPGAGIIYSSFPKNEMNTQATGRFILLSGGETGLKYVSQNWRDRK
jgi:hypothetical protein